MTFNIKMLLHHGWMMWILLGIVVLQIIPVSAAPPVLASELTVGSITTAGAKISWTQTSGYQTIFDYYKATITPDAGVTISPNPLTGGSANPEVTLTGLTPGTQYNVSVQTEKQSPNRLGKAKEVTFTAKPAAVTQTKISTTVASPTSVTLSWEDVTTGTFTNYVITIGPAAGVTITSATPAKGTTTTTITGLTAGTEYTVTMKTKSTDNKESDAVTYKFTIQKPAAVSASSISTSNVAASSATLTWGAVTTGTFKEYVITISPTTGGATVTSPIAKGTTTTAITSLTAGTSYTVTVKTRTDKGVESDPATHTFKTNPAPVTPATVSVNAITTSAATLLWGPVTGTFQTYEISISPTTGGAKADPASVTKGTTTTALKDLTPGTEYTVTIKTKDGTQLSASADKTFRTKPHPPDASKISVPTGTITTTTAKVSWEKVTTGVFDTYSISTSPASTITPTSVASTEQSPSVDLSALSAGTEYTITLKTVSGGVESDPVTKTFKTKPVAVDVGTIAVSSITINSASIAWTAVASADSYDVAVTPTTPTNPTVTHSPNTAVTATVARLTPGVEYTVSITSKKAGEAGTATTKTFRTKPVAVGGWITFSSVTTKTADATWAKVSFGVGTGYKLSISPAGPTINPNPVPWATDPPKTSLKNLIPGKHYTLKVRPVSGTTEGDATHGTVRAKPLPVTGLTLAPDSTKVTISWTAGVGSVQSAYRVRYRAIFTNPISPWTKVLVHHPQLQTAIGFIPGEKYEVEVAADSGHVLSDMATTSIVTAPLPPSSATVPPSTSTSTSMTVSWTASSANTYFTKYVVLYQKAGTTAWEKVEVSKTVLKTKIEHLVAGATYSVEIYTETKEGKRSGTGVKAARGIKLPVVDVSSINYAVPIKWPIVHDLSWGAVTGTFKTYDIIISPIRGPEKADPSSVPKGVTKCVLRELLPDTEYTITIRTNDGTRQSEGAAVKIWTIPPPDLDELDPTRYSAASVSGVIGEEPVEDYMEGSFVIDF